MNPDPTPQLPPVLPGERNNIHPYERIARPDLLNDAILLFGGEGLLVRRPFRWILNGRVVSNAYESHSMESVCTERGWKIESRFGDDIAIISGAEPPIALANGISDPNPTLKWNWMTNWCKHKGISPFVATNWSKAESEWEKLKGIGVDTSTGDDERFARESLPSSPVGEPTSDPCESEAKPEAEQRSTFAPSRAFLGSECDPNEVYVREEDHVKRGKELAAANAENVKLSDYIKKIDGIIEEVGGVTASCINPYEDLKRALTGQKEKAERFERELSQANKQIEMDSGSIERMQEAGYESEVKISQANAAVGRLRSLLELVQKASIDPMGIEMAKVMGEIYRELDTPPAPDGWISVKERKPRHRQRVIAWENRFNVFTYKGEPGDDGEGRIRMGDCTYISGDAEWSAMSDRDRAQWQNDPEVYRQANLRWDQWKGQGFCGFSDKNVTHWMPLPKPPIGKGGAE